MKQERKNVMSFHFTLFRSNSTKHMMDMARILQRPNT